MWFLGAAHNSRSVESPGNSPASTILPLATEVAAIGPVVVALRPAGTGGPLGIQIASGACESGSGMGKCHCR